MQTSYAKDGGFMMKFLLFIPILPLVLIVVQYPWCPTGVTCLSPCSVFYIVLDKVFILTCLPIPSIHVSFSSQIPFSIILSSTLCCLQDSIKTILQNSNSTISHHLPKLYKNIFLRINLKQLLLIILK